MRKRQIFESFSCSEKIIFNYYGLSLLSFVFFQIYCISLFLFYGSLDLKKKVTNKFWMLLSASLIMIKELDQMVRCFFFPFLNTYNFSFDNLLCTCFSVTVSWVCMYAKYMFMNNLCSLSVTNRPFSLIVLLKY